MMQKTPKSKLRSYPTPKNKLRKSAPRTPRRKDVGRAELAAWREKQRLYCVTGRDALLFETRGGAAVVWAAEKQLFEVRVAKGAVVRPQFFHSRGALKAHFFDSFLRAKQHAQQLVVALDTAEQALAIGHLEPSWRSRSTERTLYVAGTVRVAEGRVVFSPHAPFERALEGGRSLRGIFLFSGTPAQARRAAARRTRFELREQTKNATTLAELGTRVEANPQAVLEAFAKLPRPKARAKKASKQEGV